MSDLFSSAPKAPLAELMRPATINDVVGQSHLLGPAKPLRLAFEASKLHSFILWGPPGVGNTTLARLAAKVVNGDFVSLSAVLAGVKEDSRGGLARAATAGHAWKADGPLRRRDPPFQQGAAGRLAAVRGGGGS